MTATAMALGYSLLERELSGRAARRGVTSADGNELEYGWSVRTGCVQFTAMMEEDGLASKGDVGRRRQKGERSCDLQAVRLGWVGCVELFKGSTLTSGAELRSRNAFGFGGE